MLNITLSSHSRSCGILQLLMKADKRAVAKYTCNRTRMLWFLSLPDKFKARILSTVWQQLSS